MPKKASKPARSSVITDFERMTESMRNALLTLEQRVVTRTRDLETAVEVSREVAATLDLDVLLPRLVNLTKTRFSLYHAHVYLLDSSGQHLVMESGYGRAGKAMKKAGHMITVDAPRSIVARAARTREAILVNDTQSDESFLPNPLLPKTRSEMAIPLVAGQRLVGVLDVQSDRAGRFEDDDVAVLTTLAGLVAVAVENARAFTNLRQAQADLSRIYTMSVDMLGVVDAEGRFMQVNEAWRTTLGYKSDDLLARPIFELVHSDDLESANLEAARVAEGANTISFENRFRAKDGSYRWLSWNARPDPETGLIYFVARDTTESRQADQKIRDALARVEALFRANQALLHATTPQELLLAFAQPVSSLAPYRGAFYVFDAVEEGESADWMHLSAAIQTSEAGTLPIGQRLRLSDSAIGQTLLANPKGIVVIPDVDEAGRDFSPETLELIKQTGARSMMIVPLQTASERDLGIVTLSWPELFELKSDTLELYEILGPQLARAFENQQLLEETERSAQELAIAAEVSAQTSTILDLDLMLVTVVELAKERFGLYHVHLYTLNEETSSLKLSAGAGMAGKLMVDQGHSIPLNAERSIVARSARSGAVITSNDVRADPNFLPNPLLPETRAEISVPMLLGDQVVGVLDAQANVAGHFTDRDRRVLSILANQIASAISNARLFQATQEALAETESLYLGSQQIVGASDYSGILHAIVDSTHIGDFDRANIMLFDTPWEDAEPETITEVTLWEKDVESPEEPSRPVRPLRELPMLKRISRSEPTIINDLTQESDVDPATLEAVNQIGTRSIASFPLVANDQWIGVMTAQSTKPVDFPEAAVRRVNTLISQGATAIYNLQLIADAQARAKELATVAEISAQATRSTNLNELLHSVVELTKERFNLYHTQVYLLDEIRQMLVLTAGAGLQGQIMVEHRHAIPLDAPRSLVAKAARSREPVIANNVAEDPDHLPNPLLPETQSEMAVPMLIGQEVVGVLDVQDNTPRRFTERDRQIELTLASHIATAVSNARQFERSELRARDLAIVADVSAQASTNLALGELLFNVSDLVKERFNLYHAHIYIFDKETNDLRLAAGAGEVGRQMVTHKHSIPFDAPRSIVAMAARERRGQTVHDVRDNPAFLPNPFLPDTRSEMAVPMLLGDEVIGVLDVQSEIVERFTDYDRLTHTTLAGQIAVAAVNARLFEQTQDALAETEALYAGSEAIIRADSHQGVLDSLVETTALSDFDRVTIAMYDRPWTDEQEPDKITITALWLSGGEKAVAPVDQVYEMSQFPTRTLMTQDTPAVFKDIQTDQRIDDSIRMILSSLGMRGLTLIPLMARDQWIGALSAVSQEPYEPSEDDLRQITTLASQAASVIYVMQLLDEAKRTAEQLREVDRLKNEFLANMSHELRTPLNSIIGYSELLIDGVGQELDEMSLEDLKGIHSSGQYLLALINDILDLAKIEAGRLELARIPVNVSELAPSIIEAARVLLKDKPTVEMKMDLPEDLPTASADPVRLRQIIWNLVSNGIKFTEKGYVRLFARTKDNTLEIGVEDTGIGIPQEYHDAIFEQFRQVDGSATRRAGGTGLGLAITRQLIALHGGSIVVESEIGKGSTFSFCLPLIDGKKASPPEDAASVDKNKTNGAGAVDEEELEISNP